MLAVSRLYSFLDHKNGFNVHFLEGQKLIHDLVLMHPMSSSGFAYFRDTFLGLMPIIFFLKPAESLGIYIDSEEPYFRLKIETNSAGHTRTLLLPENFNQFPMKITGKVRVSKIFPGQKAPYTSIIELNGVENKDVINRILEDSYQSKSEVIVSEISDQAIMLTKMPRLNIKTHFDDSDSLKEYAKKSKNLFHDIFEMAPNDIEKTVETFEKHDFAYLGSRQIDFFCPCSHDRMVMNLKGLYSGDIDEIFEGKEFIEITCDYCRKKYEIKQEELN